MDYEVGKTIEDAVKDIDRKLGYYGDEVEKDPDKLIEFIKNLKERLEVLISV